MTTSVVVIGAGITGLTTAAMLSRARHDVVVLEAQAVASGTATSANTTAKISALQGLRYRTISRAHRPAVASCYAQSQLDALRWMRATVRDNDIDCAWESRPAITYATTPSGRRDLEEELMAATAAGLPVELREDTGLPFPTSGGLVLDDQAQFDPVRYLHGLAAEIDASPHGTIYEHSRVASVRGVHRHRVSTENATVNADHVVVATLLPIVYRGLFFARAEPKSSYLVALRTEGPVPEGMYLSAESPTHSLRTGRDKHDEDVLLAGGGGHKTGHGTPTEQHYQDLIAWARTHFPVSDVEARWSAHDYVPVDHLPSVGSASIVTPRVLVATGFEKWGMTMGTAAALALADQIDGERHGISASWSQVFSPARLSPRGLPTTARINGEVAVSLAAGWIRPDAQPSADGATRRHGLLPIADPGPATSSEGAVVVVCTHLGGICRWNDAEDTWDCPLHGSRFAPDGEVLTGPATRSLRHRTSS